MWRMKLRNGYHNALVRAIRYPGGTDIVLDVELCSCCNVGPGPASLTFFDVRNFQEVQTALEAARRENAERDARDEIIGIAWHDERGYLVDLMTAGGLYIDSRGLHEA